VEALPREECDARPREDSGEECAERPGEDSGEECAERPGEDSGEECAERPGEDSDDVSTIRRVRRVGAVIFLSNGSSSSSFALGTATWTSSLLSNINWKVV